MKNNTYLALIITIIIPLIISGCQPQQKPLPPDNNFSYNTNLQGINNEDNQILKKVPINITDKSMVNDLITRSNRIANRIETIDIVDRARVIVTTSQKTALVGLVLKDDGETQVTDDLKRRINSVIANTDKRIKNVLITAEPKDYDEINSIVDELNKGRSYSDFLDDIDNIQNRLAPIT